MSCTVWTLMKSWQCVRWIMIMVSATALIHVAEADTLRERIREKLAERRPTADAPASTQAQDLAGDQERTLRVGGERRTYRLHVPRGYQPHHAAPLVLALHGGGGSASYMADDANYGLISKSEQSGFVVAFPNGYSKLPGGKFATWNAGGCCGDARDRQIDDVAFLKAVVADIKSQLAIDARRVYAIGMSNGGMMSHRLACDAPEVFRAIASVAGTEATVSCQPRQSVSVLHIHALDDDHVLFNGGAGPDAFRDESKVMEFVSVPETIVRWVKREQCAATPARILQVAGAYCDRYSACADGNTVQLCVTETGGHSWPGAQSTRRGKQAPSQAISANEVIWYFFNGLRR
ncbi:prolyl oligopeptidase family serine peptidase [Burkholderiaceae bacterium DAT-1]|nr:prolyl oligopeptidase family serine peptidase [Burkholderiaceae bacterium DAT-1]